MQQNLDVMKNQIKENIQFLINDNRLDEAKILVDEYLKMFNNDVEVCSMKAIILIMKRKMDEAEYVLLNALNYESHNFDLNYNLGYIYYNTNKYELSLLYYKNAYMNADDYETKENIKETIKEIIGKLNLNEDIEKFLERSLIENQYEINDTQKSLILCNFYSVYTKEFLEKMYDKTNIKFDILTVDYSYKEKVRHGVINNVYTYKDLNKMNQILNYNEVYDIIHVHFLDPFYGEVAEQIRNKCKKLIITIWGSDFYRTTSEQKEQQRKLVEKADLITFDNEVTCDEFLDYYGQNLRDRTTINRFGLVVLEHMKKFRNIPKEQLKEEFGIPKNSIVVTCGYNANPAHNHIQIINSIKGVKKQLLKNLFFIFPMTYSRDEVYISTVKEILSKSGLNYKILEDFRENDEVAKWTLISDFMIQVQTTDTLSSSMLEQMYGGSIVITGSWLPYKPIKDLGAFYCEVLSPNDVGNKMLSIVKNIKNVRSKCEKNEKIIWDFSAWEKNISGWTKNYDPNYFKLKTKNSVKEQNIKNQSGGNKVWDKLWQGYSDINPMVLLNDLGGMALRSEFVEILNRFFMLNNSKVIEVGCGGGQYAMELALRGAKCIGVDVSKESLSLASNNAKYFNVNNVEFRKDDGFKLSFQDNTFDIAFNMGVLEHFKQEEILKMVREMGRVGKFVIIGVPYSDAKIYKLSKKFSQITGTWEYGYEDDFDSFDYYLENAGLTKLYECVIGCMEEPLYLKRVNHQAIPIALAQNFESMFKNKSNIGSWLIVVAARDEECAKNFKRLNDNSYIEFSNNKVMIKENNLPKVSMVIPFYNSEKYMMELTENLDRINYEKLEIIFVNDGSNDNSEEILKKCLLNGFNHKYQIESIKDNVGLFNARFIGIKKATGKYIYFHDADDIAYCNGIKRLVNDMKNFQDGVILPVSSVLMNKREFNGSIWQHLLMPKVLDYISEEICNLSGRLSMSNTIISKSKLMDSYIYISRNLKKIGVERLNYDEDAIITNFLILKGLIKKVIPVYYTYLGYERGDEKTTSRSIEKQVNEMPIRIAFTVSKLIKDKYISKVQCNQIDKIISKKAEEIFDSENAIKFMDKYFDLKQEFIKIL